MNKDAQGIEIGDNWYEYKPFEVGVSGTLTCFDNTPLYKKVGVRPGILYLFLSDGELAVVVEKTKEIDQILDFLNLGPDLLKSA